MGRQNQADADERDRKNHKKILGNVSWVSSFLFFFFRFVANNKQIVAHDLNRVTAVAVADLANAQFDKDKKNITTTMRKKVAPNEPKQMLSITLCNNIPRSTSIKTISQLITLLGRVFVSVSVSVHYANIYALLKPYASLPLAICLIIFLLLFSLRISVLFFHHLLHICIISWCFFFSLVILFRFSSVLLTLFSCQCDLLQLLMLWLCAIFQSNCRFFFKRTI